MSWRARLSRQVQEIRVLLCPQSTASEGARQFINSEYAELKLLNPRLPILVREGNQRPAFLIARYDFAEEESIPIDNKTPQQILDDLKALSEAGDKYPRSAESTPRDWDIIQLFPDDPANFTRYSSVYGVRPKFVGVGEEFF